jgi:hypothetical protein
MAEPASESDGANRLESTALTVIFAGISGTLLLLLGAATKSGSASADWWTRPAFAPSVALSVLVAANLLTLWRELSDLRARPPSVQERAEAWDCFTGWLRPVEFLAYYAAYVWAIQHVGYFVGSLAFVSWLLYRVGLRQGRWLLWGALFCVALIGVFRMGLGVWMPAPAAYDLFPDAVRTALMRWF